MKAFVLGMQEDIFPNYGNNEAISLSKIQLTEEKYDGAKRHMYTRSSSSGLNDEDACVSSYVCRISLQNATSTFAGFTCLDKLIKVLQSSLEALEVKPNDTDLEKWAYIVHECMSGNGRNVSFCKTRV